MRMLWGPHGGDLWTGRSSVLNGSANQALLSAASSPAASAAPTASSIAASYANLPLAFEQNRGQTDSSVDYLARTGLHRLPLARQCGFDLLNGQGGNVLQLDVAGGNPAAVAAGQDRLPGTSNYIVGNNAADNLSGVANMPACNIKTSITASISATMAISSNWNTTSLSTRAQPRRDPAWIPGQS